MFLKDLLFPKTCLGCGYLGAYICPRCKRKLIYLEKASCLYCEGSSFQGLTHAMCKRKLGIDGFLSLFSYNNFLKKIIKQLKYRFSYEIWQDFYQVVQPKYLEKIRFYKQLKKNFYLQPIPLHHKKLKERGFNQAVLITDFLIKILNFSKSDSLIRRKSTVPQAQLKDKKDRYLNLHGAFFIEDEAKVKQKNFIIVDDVITTGATIKEAGRVLKIAGASSVFAFSLASG